MSNSASDGTVHQRTPRQARALRRNFTPAESSRDEVRDAWLVTQGFRVVRFWNHDVLKRRERVLATILAAWELPF